MADCVATGRPACSKLPLFPIAEMW